MKLTENIGFLTADCLHSVSNVLLIKCRRVIVALSYESSFYMESGPNMDFSFTV